MVGLPTKYRKTRERNITSYDFFDIASGTGIKRYYGAAISGATIGTSNYVLSDQVFYSGKTAVSATGHGGSSSSNVQVNERDWDILFNTPQTLKGTAIINATMGVNNIWAGGADAVNQRLIAELFIIGTDDNVRVEMGSAISLLDINAALAQNAHDSRQVGLGVEIAETHIKVGEKLRLRTIQAVFAGNTKLWGIGCDPKDRNDSEVPQTILDADATILTIDLPFRIVL